MLYFCLTGRYRLNYGFSQLLIILQAMGKKVLFDSDGQPQKKSKKTKEQHKLRDLDDTRKPVENGHANASFEIPHLKCA